jgi:hypothetical protein
MLDIPFYNIDRERAEECDQSIADFVENQKKCEAAKRCLVILREADLDKDCEISLEEFRKIFVEVC